MLKAFFEQLGKLCSSPSFLSCVFSWFCAQFIKTLINLFTGKVHSVGELLELLIWRTGGMPSSHSSIVACLVTTIGFSEGITSNTFILSFVFFLVVIRDAVGVRRANGIQANVLNRLGHELKDKELIAEYKKIKEVQGHTPMEVIVGIILGFFIGVGFSVL